MESEKSVNKEVFVRVGMHMLTAYPPSNPNRDETQQPKTAIVGGVNRQRISSQSIKRAWRLSEPMAAVGDRSLRTRRFGDEIMKVLLTAGVEEKTARRRASDIAGMFGKVSKKKPPETEEIVILGHEEWDAAMTLAGTIAGEKRDATKEELESLGRPTVSVDCAMFGRMRAANPGLNIDAAVSVSHPMTTNKVTVESDFWTAVDDLKGDDDDLGAGGMNEREFGSGVYYTYVEASTDALERNLGGRRDQAIAAVSALIEAMATVTPKGHRTSFGNNVRASYMRVEVGQPCGNLMMSAFEKPVQGTVESINALREAARKEIDAYGLKASGWEFSVPEGKGSLAEIRSQVEQALRKGT